MQKIETPQHPAAALGTEVDDTQLQPYLRDGRPIDFSRDSGYIAAAGLAFLPQPKAPGLQVQKHFVMPSPTWRDGQHVGFGFQGYIDLWLPDSSAVPDMPGGAPFVGDFKTTGDLKWAKSETTLREDVQAMLYATHALYETKSKEVDLAWIYFQTKGPRKAKRTKLRVAADHVCEQFGKINETAVEMLEVRKANPHPSELPPEPDMCEAYGGCPYRARCNLSPAQIVAALEAKEARLARTQLFEDSMTAINGSNQTTSLLDKLKAKKAGATPAAPSTVTVAPMPAQLTIEEHIAKNPQAAWLTAPERKDPRYEVVGQRPDGGNVYAFEANGQPAPINPPESTFPLAPPVGQEEAPKKRGRPAKQAPKDPLGADMAAAVETPSRITTVVMPGPSGLDSEKIIQIAKAVRAAADAFLAAMDAA